MRIVGESGPVVLLLPGGANAADGRLEDAADAVHAALVLADRFGVPLRSWPGAEHAVHLTHEAEVLDVCRAVVRRVVATA